MKITKWLKIGLSLLILVFLGLYVKGHWQQLKQVLSLKLSDLGIMYVLCFVIAFVSGKVVQVLVKGLDVSTRVGDMVLLQNAALLLNYAPMKFGTLFRAHYLKRHYGLAYAHFATFFLYITFLMAAASAGIGVLCLALFFGFTGSYNLTLGAVFLLVVIGSLVFLFFPLPIPKVRGGFTKALNNFITGRAQIASRKKIIIYSAMLLVVNFILTACRIAVIYGVLGENMHLSGYLILGALGYVTMFVSITPGSLGIRELVLSSGAVILGVPAHVGVAAAIMDRAVTFTYALVAGGISTMWLWHRSPSDFQKTQFQNMSLGAFEDNSNRS